MVLWDELLLEMPAQWSHPGVYWTVGSRAAPIVTAAPGGSSMVDEPVDPIPADLLLLMDPGL